MRAGACLALVAAACATVAPDPVQAPASLAAAESAFAAHSVREGMRAAFIAHFAPEGVFIRDGWTVARDFLTPRPDPPIVLDWRPVFVLTAASGDFGLSTGPWKVASKAKPEAPASHGQFISIWRREGEGAWKVAADLGIFHPAPDLWDAPLVARAVAAPASVPEAFAAAEARFNEETRRAGTRAAYAAHASDGIRLYRNGASPGIGKAGALALVESERPVGWTVERMETARSGDLAYARGRYGAPGRDETGGYFLRVWQREASGWRIVLDVINPVARKPS